ncbi:MAG: hypothetical protein IJS68_03890 [Clostridia bacterium]|nr:hypothetical protein [Clostridia bacterium]
MAKANSSRQSKRSDVDCAEILLENTIVALNKLLTKQLAKRGGDFSNDRADINRGFMGEQVINNLDFYVTNKYSNRPPLYMAMNLQTLYGYNIYLRQIVTMLERGGSVSSAIDFAKFQVERVMKYKPGLELEYRGQSTPKLTLEEYERGWMFAEAYITEKWGLNKAPQIAELWTVESNAKISPEAKAQEKKEAVERIRSTPKKVPTKKDKKELAVSWATTVKKEPDSKKEEATIAAGQLNVFGEIVPQKPVPKKREKVEKKPSEKKRPIGERRTAEFYIKNSEKQMFDEADHPVYKDGRGGYVYVDGTKVVGPIHDEEWTEFEDSGEKER